MRKLTTTTFVFAAALLFWTGAAGCARPVVQPKVAESRLAAAQDAADVFQGEAAEVLLKNGRVTNMATVPTGLTAPRRATLQLEDVAHDALFKDIEFLRPGVTQLSDGTVVSNMEDNWRFEIAAYRIDRLIGLGLVPATVERSYRGKQGSLQWWVVSEMSESERRRGNLQPPDSEAWNRQQFKMHLFDELICNWDRHLNNILITKEFELRLIDHSRAFLTYDQLRTARELTRFSRSLLAGLERLNRDDLRREVGDYIEASKLDALLKRRDAILELARKAVEERGEAAVLYP
jgi:hypothetical protein